MLALLVVVSLILLTAYFGESPQSPLHSVQRGIVQVFSPVQAGASKVLSPVRDVANWVSDTLRAKSNVDKLRKANRDLTAQLATLKTEQLQNQQLTAEVGLDQTIGIRNYHPVGANVIGRDPSLWYQQVEVDAGSDEGVEQGDPVLADGGLVGDVTTVDASVSIVTLITAPSYAAAAQVTDRAGDQGILAPSVGNPNQLLLTGLARASPGRPGRPGGDHRIQVRLADVAVPAGPSDRHRGHRQPQPAVQQQRGSRLAHRRSAPFRLGSDPDSATRRQRPGPGAVSPPPLRLILRLVLLALGTVVIQEAAVSQISIFGISADLTPLMVMSVGLLAGSLTGAVMGFATGLLVDTVLVQTLGITSLLYIAIGYWSGRLRELRDPAHGLVPLAAGAAATAVAGIGMTLIQFLLGVDAPVSLLLFQQIFITILVNTLISLPVYAVVRRIIHPALPDDPRRRRRRAYTTGGLSPLQSSSKRLGQLNRGGG